jgi:hypothetical protein
MGEEEEEEEGGGRSVMLAAAYLEVEWKEQTLTLAVSYNSYVFMSTMSPVSPSIPHECSPFACLPRVKKKLFKP